MKIAVINHFVVFIITTCTHFVIHSKKKRSHPTLHAKRKICVQFKKYNGHFEFRYEVFENMCYLWPNITSLSAYNNDGVYSIVKKEHTQLHTYASHIL